MLFEQLREHDGDSFIKRPAARSAQHWRISLPLGRKFLSCKDGQIGALIYSCVHCRGIGLLRRFAHGFSIVLIDQIVNNLEDGRFYILAFRAVERSSNNVVLGELQTRQGDLIIVNRKRPFLEKLLRVIDGLGWILGQHPLIKQFGRR